MASRRRPRTRVYDCNFNIGESYYKPVMDSLDRKYSGRPLDPVTSATDREGTPSSRASRLFGDREKTPSNRGSRLQVFETNGIESHKPSRAPFIDDDDAAIDAEFESTMNKIKATRAARNRELEDEFDSYASKKRINFADHLLDSVGLNSKTQKAIEDDVIYKQKSSTRKFLDDDEDKVMAKWTAVRPGAKALQEAEQAADEVSAVARARKSRARIHDIDAELEDLATKSAARQKRISDLKALVGESSDSQDASTATVTKRISVKTTTEKKQVSF